MTASVAVAALLLGGVAAGAAYASARSAAHQRDVVLPAAVASRSLLASLVDQETGERGYLITGQDKFLQPYTAGQTRVTQLFQSLRKEVDRVDLGLLDAVVAADHTWLTETAAPEIASVRAGNRQAAANQEASGLGLTQFDNLRAAVGALSAALERELSESERTVRRENQLTFALVVVESAGLLILALSSRALLRRWVNDPIERLAGDVRVVAQGQLDHSVPATGSTELRSLGGDVEAMRRRLRDELEETRKSREALAQAGPVVVKLRAELAPSNSGACDQLAVAGRLAPAEGVLAGDWYDVISLKPDMVAAVMVDISGHGAEAGIFALQIKQLLLPALRLGLAPGDALGWVSEQLGTTDEQYATGLVITIDLSSGQSRWANAGHPAALHNRAGTITTLASTGPIIGPLPGVWQTEELAFEPSDLLALYTDGITEARDAGGHQFGMGAVIERFRLAAPGGPDEVVEELLTGVRDHTRAVLLDDATVLVLELRHPRPRQ